VWAVRFCPWPLDSVTGFTQSANPQPTTNRYSRAPHRVLTEFSTGSGGTRPGSPRYSLARCAARRRSSRSRIWYRRSMLEVRCPLNAITTCGSFPLWMRWRTPDRRRSCTIRPSRPIALHARRHVVRKLPSRANSQDSSRASACLRPVASRPSRSRNPQVLRRRSSTDPAPLNRNRSRRPGRRSSRSPRGNRATASAQKSIGIRSRFRPMCSRVRAALLTPSSSTDVDQ
jgi:hypothetical protein